MENDWVTGNVVLNVGGRPLEMEMTVPAQPVKPTRMLPLFQMITDAVVDTCCEESAERGREISCKAGCAACCRQAVPVSELEVYRIAELVGEMPEPMQSEVRERFSAAAAHFEETGWFGRMSDHFSRAKGENKELTKIREVDLGAEYFGDRVDCPFLDNERCLIHNSRPVVCREFVVTSPAENCWSPAAGGVDVLEMKINVSEVLPGMGTAGRMRSEGFLPLIRALELAEKYPEQFAEKTGERWVSEFFGRLTG